MDLKKVAADLQQVIEASEKFLSENENEMLEFIGKRELTAEECLQRQEFFDLMNHISAIRNIQEYMAKDVTKTGVLGKDEQGELTLDDEVLPLMSEVEVLAFDEFEEKEIWIKTFVGGAEKRYLVGFEKDRELCGLTARIRA